MSTLYMENYYHPKVTETIKETNEQPMQVEPSIESRSDYYFLLLIPKFC